MGGWVTGFISRCSFWWLPAAVRFQAFHSSLEYVDCRAIDNPAPRIQAGLGRREKKNFMPGFCAFSPAYMSHFGYV